MTSMSLKKTRYWWWAASFLAWSVAVPAGAQVIGQPSSYPRVDLRPAFPAVGDMITLRLVLGLASSPCEAPTYTDTSFEIKTVDEAAQPPLYAVVLSYTEIPRPPDLICPLIYQPTEYGPSYRLGALPHGTYIVKDGGRAVDTFTVILQPLTQRLSLSGTVFENTGALPVIRTLAGVKVYLQVPELIGGPILLSPPWWPSYVTIDSTVSDQNGAYAFASLEPQTYRLLFLAAGYQPHTETLTPHADTVVNVWLLREDATVTITGAIYEGCPPGTQCLWTPPLPGCTVTVTVTRPILPDGGILDKSMKSMELSAVSDRDGKYSITGIPVYDDPAVIYEVTARKSGFATQTKRAEVRYGIAVRVDFVMEPLSSYIRAQPHTHSAAVPKPGSAGLRRAVVTEEGARYRVYGADGRVMGISHTIAPGIYVVRRTADGVVQIVPLTPEAYR